MIIDDTTECESQDNGLAKVAVREVKSVAGELHKERHQLETPGVALARLLRCESRVGVGRSGPVG